MRPGELVGYSVMSVRSRVDREVWLQLGPLTGIWDDDQDDDEIGFDVEEPVSLVVWDMVGTMVWEEFRFRLSVGGAT